VFGLILIVTAPSSHLISRRLKIIISQAVINSYTYSALVDERVTLP
jgi:hypothetical protein